MVENTLCKLSQVFDLAYSRQIRDISHISFAFDMLKVCLQDKMAAESLPPIWIWRLEKVSECLRNGKVGHLNGPVLYSSASYIDF